MKLSIVNVRLPKEIVQWLDSLVERGIYHSRAEAIREFTRDYLTSQDSLLPHDLDSDTQDISSRREA